MGLGLFRVACQSFHRWTDEEQQQLEDSKWNDCSEDDLRGEGNRDGEEENNEYERIQIDLQQRFVRWMDDMALWSGLGWWNETKDKVQPTEEINEKNRSSP